jgi:membrane protein YqaA with SNARE-associated domain
VRFLVFAWGLAEAMLFFVVADVPITLLTARRGFRTGLVVSLWATAGALLGGLALYFWSAADPTGVAQMLDWVPAVSPGLIAASRQQVAADWIAATLIAGFSGDPYKLYAAAAGASNTPLLPFLAISFAARLLRFVVTAAIAWGFASVLKRHGRERWALPLVRLFWIAFYAWYWTTMPW